MLCEQFDFGHARGSSHGASRIFRLAYSEVDYVRFAQHAAESWLEMERALGVQLLEVTGGLDIGPPESLDVIASALSMAGAGFEHLTHRKLAARFPAFEVPDGWVGLYQARTGVLRAGASMAGFVELARESGAVVKPRTHVTRITPHQDSVVVETSEGAITAASVVVASGAWANRVLEPLHLRVPMHVTRVQSANFHCRSRPHDPVLPFIWHVPGGPRIYGLPNGDTDEIKVGEDRPTAEVDPDSPPVVDPRHLDPVLDFVRENLPALQPAPASMEVCLEASTPDDDFVLDRVGQIILAVGFGGHGFKFAPAIGEVIADLLAGKPSPFPARFGFARFLAQPDLSFR